jgi:hypothetical protein
VSAASVMPKNGRSQIVHQDRLRRPGREISSQKTSTDPKPPRSGSLRAAAGSGTIAIRTEARWYGEPKGLVPSDCDERKTAPRKAVLPKHSRSKIARGGVEATPTAFSKPRMSHNRIAPYFK